MTAIPDTPTALAAPDLVELPVPEDVVLTPPVAVPCRATVADVETDDAFEADTIPLAALEPVATADAVTLAAIAPCPPLRPETTISVE